MPAGAEHVSKLDPTAFDLGSTGTRNIAMWYVGVVISIESQYN